MRSVQPAPHPVPEFIEGRPPSPRRDGEKGQGAPAVISQLRGNREAPIYEVVPSPRQRGEGEGLIR
ncbi:hypothetical protein Rhsp01_27070 [Rhizobium sp. NBRC 114257]|uniref:Uncharacterized protein n=1 Tax=Rhizobium dioscoreae TaxID=2653122 RepID=A0ABQ0Z5W8_9HYPH|nr:hypothetical protein RsS93_33210 [Rhizobium dioscoreae]GLU81531.1 hypothetical protein Rhsp01_27070 [Rhizobium sp. NBRC 114257]